MTSLDSLKHQCNKIALAAIVFLLTTMIEVREQTMLTEHPVPTEDLTYSKQITTNSRIQSTTMSSSSPSTASSDPPTSTSEWSESPFSPTLPMTPSQMAWPSSLAVPAESLLIQNVTSAVTDTSTRPHHESTVEEGTPAGSVTTTYAMASGARSITTASAGSSRGPTKTSEAQYDGSKHTTFRPLIIPTLPDVRRSRVVHSMPYQSKHHHERHWGPFFEESVNVTSGAALPVGYHLSTEAILNCRVGRLKDKTKPQYG
ncbi:mucin-2-like [Anopheles coustani]|uniref:mucin-2-like n=1 Tax=Anopheles coustani TaxID=139045 RepID=UPI0026588BD7|nr:mucin-2-like [Anopheles coustani]